MKAYQLLQAISPEQRLAILCWIQKESKEAFRTALFQVGAQRKLRPQYFQTKNREQQAAWLSDNLKSKLYDGVTDQLLQLWLLKGKTAMLIAFLDAAEIKHDGQGQVDDLPEELSAKQVKAGVDAILKDNTPAEVAIYLHLFQRQKEGGWPEIAKELEKRDELKLEVPAK
jgi:CDP-glycerol glycerophosphotransferase (TagB/SpsB family)